ncbi:hypothetical protein O181_007487 [Austropuccinia psidii MF-1]|uniref:Uncharacterized protein n=1 Tax=Austropuccinia psidii MF-1 TaxID=1389203 RepID=A0A9Q3GII9_9BASI|nr:hypothetical protein [Austropuccinia psidii MF-1]
MRYWYTNSVPEIHKLYFLTLEENSIPLETHSQANIAVTPSESEGSKGKVKRHSGGLITAKKQTPIATQRSRKPQNSESIQGKTTLITCTGKIKSINPVVTSKGKLPKALDNKFFQGTVKEDREGLSRTRSARGGHLRHSGGWKDIEGNDTHSSIHFQIQQKPQTRGLEGYGSSSSAPPTPQIPFSMEHGQQKVQPSIPLSRTWSKFPEDISQRDGPQRPYGNHQRKTAEPDREYSDSFRLTRSRPNHLSSSFTPFRNQQISGQESPFFTIPGIFQEKTRIQGQKQDLFQHKAERVRPNDPEAF